MLFIPTELLGIIRRRSRVAQTLLLAGVIGSLQAADDEDLLELDPLTIYGETDPMYGAERRIREIGKTLPQLDTRANERPTAVDETLEALGLTGDGIQATHPDNQRHWAETLDKLQSDGSDD